MKCCGGWIPFSQVDVNAKYESLEEEVQVKGKQLKKLFEKYQAKKSEIGDLQVWDLAG